MKDNKVLKVLKPVNIILSLISIALGVLAIVVLVLFNFAEVITIYTNEGTKYADGFSYPGYQTIYYGFGNMIIQGYQENGFNIWMFLGFFLPFVGCIVACVMLSTNLLRKGTNKKRAILEAIVGLSLIFGAIMIYNVDKLWIANAQNVKDSYTDYYATYLLPAINGELYFGKDTFPDFVFVICLLVGIVKLVNCCSLLFQKYYARSVNKQQVEVVKKGDVA